MKTPLLASLAALTLLGACASAPEPVSPALAMPRLADKDAKAWSKASDTVAKGEKLVAKAEKDLSKAEDRAEKAKKALRNAEKDAEDAKADKRKGEKLVAEGKARLEKLEARALPDPDPAPEAAVE